MEGFLTRRDYERFLAFPQPFGGLQWRGRAVETVLGAKPAHRVTVAGPCGTCTQLPFDNIGLSKARIARGCRRGRGCRLSEAGPWTPTAHSNISTAAQYALPARLSPWRHWPSTWATSSTGLATRSIRKRRSSPRWSTWPNCTASCRCSSTSSRCGRRAAARCPAPSGRYTVDVFITTYNEDVALLRQTVRAALAMRYPHRTYVCDDGRRAEVEALAQELGCGYITRADNRHAKAGNWNNAFAQTDGRPDPDPRRRPRAAAGVPRAHPRLLRGPERVALVQVPQQYHNLDSVQHQVNWDERRMYGEQDVFFDLVMPGKDHWNAAFFCGTGAVLRRERARAARRHRHRQHHRGHAHVDRAAQRGLEVGLRQRSPRDRAGADRCRVLPQAAAALGRGQPQDHLRHQPADLRAG